MSLQEIRGVQQLPHESRRRWFRSRDLDLIVWIRDEGPVGFQLCYESLGRNRVLTLSQGEYSQSVLDEGDASVFRNEAPILVGAPAFDRTKIVARFQKEAATIDPEIGEYVLGHLRTWPV